MLCQTQTNQSKFARPQKLVNQLTLNGRNVIEIAKTCTVALMKARRSLFFQCREKRVKKTEGGENMFFEAFG